MAFINSNKVKMYPTGFRQASIDLQSGQNTEENLTKTKKLSQYANNNNYSFVENDNLIIYLDGYYFKVAVTDIPHANNLYAYIKLVDKTMQVEGNDVTLKTLVNISNSTTTLDSNGEFKGLAFDTTVPNDCIGILVKDANGHIITQPLKVSANEIRNVTNGASADDTDQTEDPIHVKFDTDDLKINDGSNSEIPVKALVSPTDVSNRYYLISPTGASGKPGWVKEPFIQVTFDDGVLIENQISNSGYYEAKFNLESFGFQRSELSRCVITIELHDGVSVLTGQISFANLKAISVYNPQGNWTILGDTFKQFKLGTEILWIGLTDGTTVHSSPVIGNYLTIISSKDDSFPISITIK